jgi:alpha-tubulin suppressor-like RCC1 family protein
VDITAGHYHTCATQRNGELKCWGDNFYGQLDIPDYVTNPSKIMAKGYQTCAIVKKTAYCW